MNEDKAAINFRVMTDTVNHYTSDPDLVQAVQFSVDHEKIYWGDVPIKKQSKPDGTHKTKITVLSCDTLASAALHKGGNGDSYQTTFIFKASFAGVIAPEKGEKVAIDPCKHV